MSKYICVCALPNVITDKFININMNDFQRKNKNIFQRVIYVIINLSESHSTLTSIKNYKNISTFPTSALKGFSRNLHFSEMELN